MKCPECNTAAVEGAKFCNECGARMPEPAKTSSGEGVQIGEKAVVAGDAIGGDKTEIKTHGGDAHVHHHTDQTKEVRECSVCGQQGLRIDFHKCPSCNEPACEECYLVEKRRCGNCEKRAIEQYQERFGSAFADGNVASAERAELRQLAAELHISKDQARELEAPLRNRGGGAEGELSRMARVTFNKARQLLEEFKTKEALEEIGPLNMEHGRTNEAVRETYLLALVEENQEELLAEVQRILDDEEVDDAMAYLCRVEVLMRQGKLAQAEKENRKAQAAFRDDIRFKAQEAELTLESYRQKQDEGYLAVATEILNELGEDTHQDAYASSVAALREFLEGNKTAMEVAEKTLRESNLSPFYVVRRMEIARRLEETAGIKRDFEKWRQSLSTGKASTDWLKANAPSALENWKQSAQAGNPMAQCLWADCNLDGVGVPKNHKEAAMWFRKAAEQGNANGQRMLGWFYYKGKGGVAQDHAEAVKWFRKAAEQEYAVGQCMLGSCYYKGEGVAQDHAEALKWFRKAAEQGYAGGQCMLGVCYYNGEGVTKDHAEAVKWFRKAAEQGYAGGQNWLGWCYQNGNGGVVIHFKEAKRLYAKAAEQGNANAKKNLRKLGG